VPGVQEQQIPQNAVLPKEWYIFSAWEPLQDEMGAQFEQVFQIFWPNGEKFSEARSVFKVSDSWQYNTLQLMGFPVGQEGNLRVVTWIDNAGQPISDLVECRVRIHHGPAPAPPPIPDLQISR